MLTQTLKIIFEKDLKKLIDEIELYKNEKKLWSIEEQISNSAGNLILHLVGNLNHFIGAEIGKTGYIRNRENEFILKNISKLELIEKINNTIKVVQDSLDKLEPEDLKKKYPLMVFNENASFEYLLINLTTHLNFHLGQINYHRRLLDK